MADELRSRKSFKEGCGPTWLPPQRDGHQPDPVSSRPKANRERRNYWAI